MSDTAEETAGAFVPKPLDAILSQRAEPRSEGTDGQSSPPPEPPAREEPGDTPPAPETQAARDERGRFAPKPQEATTPPPGEESADKQVPLNALREERTKRQQTERQLAEARALLEQLQRQPVAPPAPQVPPQQQAPPPPAAFWDDPDNFVERRVSTVEQRVQASLLALSEQVAMARYQDFTPARDAFMQAAQANPDLARRCLSAENPAEFAYQVGKQALTLQRLGPDPDAYIQAEVERRVAEKLAQTQPQPSAASHPPLPKSLAASASVPPRSAQQTQAPFAPKSLDEILARPRR